MASSYTTSYGIEKIGSGEQAGTWGTTTNHNLDLLDRIAAYTSVALSGTTHTLTVREASPGSGTENLQDGMYRVIKFTGALGANNTVTIAPNTTKAYFIIENATTDSGSSGPYSVILSQGSGANVTVQNGKNVIVYCDGAGSGAAVVDALADLQVGSLEVTGAAAIDGGLAVTGNVTATGTVEPAGDTAASDNAAIGYTSAEGLILTGQGSTNDVTIKNDADADVLEIPTGTTNVTVVGDVTAGGTLNVTGDTAAGDDAAMGYTSAEGLILTGQGSTNDVTIKNDADADVLEIPTGTTNVTVVGDVTAGGTLNVTGDTAAGDDAAMGYTSAEGLILTGQGSTNDVTIKNDADAEVLEIPTGTTNVTVVGDFTAGGTLNVTGDTASGDDAAVGYTSTEGLILTGQGSTGDVTVKNDADAVVMQVPTGTTGVDFKGNIFTTTAGTSNFVAGVNAGNTIESGGNYNVCVGDEAGTAVTTGDANIYIGFQAGDAATTGGDNVAIGYDALTTMSTAASNTVVGAYAGDAINTGHQNTLIGHQAGTDLTTGAQNTFLGKNAGDDVTDGAENTLVGFNAAAHSTALTTGDFNVHLGIYTSASSADAQTETVIGYNGQGKGNTTGFIINNGGVYQGNNSADWSTTSDRRIKKNIEDNEQGLDIINNIRVRNFEYRTEDEITEVPPSAAIETEGVQLGVIAQEIEEVLPEVVNEESTGVKSVNSGNLTWYLVNAVKELSAQVEELKQWKASHSSDE